MPKLPKNTLRLFLIGFAMGTADTVPGVSGGTIAFIFGVYEELILSIKKLSGEILKLLLQGQFKKAYHTTPLAFLLPLGLGILLAIASLARIVEFLLENQPVFIWSFFFGLMVASIVIVKNRVVHWNTNKYLALAISAIAAYFMVALVPVETPATLLAFFLAGSVAIIAMILPGISGSFLLILLGKYEQVLHAVSNQDILPLIGTAAGAVVGLALFSRVLLWAFQKHHDIVVAALTGFMLGSLRKIWPWKSAEANTLPNALDINLLLAILLASAAIWLMFYLNTLGVTKEEVGDVKDKKFAIKHKKALES